jgi:integrative and conjugative element protein (TIGR02256 family)
MHSRLVISRRAFAMLSADCLRYRTTETGGILVGKKVGSDFVVPFVIDGGPRASRSRSGFTPDSDWQQHQLDYLFHRFRLDYVGDHHRHPGRFERPSAIDLATAKRVVTEPAWDKAEAVFPIATIQSGIVRMRAFLMRRDSDDFDEIPLAVVPDNDRRIRRLLLTETNPSMEVPHAICPSCGQPRSARRRGPLGFLSRLRPRTSR